MKKYSQVLKSSGINTPRMDVEVLLSYILNYPRIKLYTEHDMSLKKEEYKKLKEMVSRRKKAEPIAYITGKKEFYSLSFKVTENVLIPRPETEILVEAILDQKFKEKTVLDIGTGSGNIAISLKKHNPTLRITATDISKEALTVARENASTILGEHDIQFLHSDLFENIHQKYDIIVSNPPYIPTWELNTLMPDVKEYEPVRALDGGRDGYLFYEKIINQSTQYLNQKGNLFMEMNPVLCPDITGLLERSGFKKIKIIRDYEKRKRVVSARF